MNIGDTVRANVTRTEVYGVYCQREAKDILILIPEISWIACFNNCHQFAEAGDEITCKIIHFDQAHACFVGSIRQLHPENNPWDFNRLFQAGDIVKATVVRWVDQADRCDGKGGYLLELRPAAYVMLCGELPGTYRAGDNCHVKIVKTNRSLNSFQVELVT